MNAPNDQRLDFGVLYTWCIQVYSKCTHSLIIGGRKKEMGIVGKRKKIHFSFLHDLMIHLVML